MTGAVSDEQTGLLVLPGDGIGPELASATIDILKETDRCFDLNLRFEEAQIGFKALKSAGTTFPEAVFKKAKAADGVILGPVSHNDYPPTDQGDSIPQASYVDASIFMPISGPPAHAADCRAAVHVNLTSLSSVKTLKAFMPIVRCASDPANSCPRPILP